MEIEVENGFKTPLMGYLSARTGFYKKMPAVLRALHAVGATPATVWAHQTARL